MAEESSYRQALRSSSIIGGASVANILVGVFRTKVAALLLGPSGVGLIGILQSLMATSAAVAGLGLGNVGTRQIAESAGRDDAKAIETARRALFLAALFLALIGGGSVWALRHTLSKFVLNDLTKSAEVGWLALGVALTVVAAAQGALLTGLRQVGALARISVGAALLSSGLGIAALAAWGAGGIVIFVLSLPLSTFLFGRWFVNRLGRLRAEPIPLERLAAQWKTMAALGLAFMVSEVLATASQLASRALIQRRLGLDAVGLFQAASLLSLTYIGFVLSAMAVDYYPRLTAAIGEQVTVNRLVNEQSEMALLLAGPIFIAMLGWAPWLVQLLYSAEFHGAVPILRFQVLGDVLKVASWPLGFILLASGDGRMFLLTEALAAALFVFLTWIALPALGVTAAGAAFLGIYLAYLPIVLLLARRRTRFRWSGRVAGEISILAVAATAVALAGVWSELAALLLGTIGSIAAALIAAGRLGSLTELPPPFDRLARAARRTLPLGRFWHD